MLGFRGETWFIVTSVLEQKVEGRNKEGGSKRRVVGGVLGERRWREACPRGCTCVYSPLWGVCAKEEAENVGEGGTWTREGGGVELPGIRVALWKWPVSFASDR